MPIEDDPELTKAIEELHQYLSDQLAPLMMVDSIDLLLQQPPALSASGIYSWLSGLTKRDTSVTVSDYLYHAVVKIHQMHEYKLVSMKDFLPYWVGLKQSVLEYCPED